MLKASALSEDPIANLQLALGIELAVLPPYLYALWSIKSAGEGASQAAAEAAYAIRTVVYEEMLHAGLVANLLNALGARPDLTAHLMSYPGPLPGHVTEPPWGYEVGLGPLCTTGLSTFLRVERPVWDPPPDLDQGWITLGQFYGTLRQQLGKLPEPAFGGGHQVPLSDNPGPGEMVQVVDLPTALNAIETVVDQGEGHRPKNPSEPASPAPDPAAESDDDHEVAHYYQFQTLAQYFTDGLIDPRRDVHPVIANPRAEDYTPEQQVANRAFNDVYTSMLDRLQVTLASDAPQIFGAPTELMLRLGPLAAALRATGTVPGTSYLAGPTFEYLGPGAGAPR